MIIKYTNYSDGIHQIELSKAVREMNLPEPFFGDVRLDCKMDKSVHQIYLDCNLFVNANLICDRCGGNFQTEITNNFKVIYFFEEKQYTNELNVHFIQRDLSNIDLSEEVYEYAQLSVPLKVLCRPDCKGLCQYCGANLNTTVCSCNKKVGNPVWDKLKLLKEN